MKQILTITFLLMSCLSLQAQIVIYANGLVLPGGQVDSISTDGTFSDATNADLMTAAAIKTYVDASVASPTFDSDRPILRVPEVGDNVGGSTVQDFLEYFYFAPPVLSLSIAGGTVFEVGTSNSLTVSGGSTNPASATLSNGTVQITNPTPATEFQAFGASAGYSKTFTFAPTQGGSADYTQLTYSLQASQDWSGGGQSGTNTTGTATVTGVYPVLYGMVADTATAFADPYGTLTKLVQTEGNKTVSLTGTGLIIYGFPQTWADTNLSSIIDPNGFNVTASFTRVTYPTVTSTGLVNNYTDVPYLFYFLNTGSTTTSASNYTFNR